jgi:hypothetical protein
MRLFVILNPDHLRDEGSLTIDDRGILRSLWLPQNDKKSNT